MNDIEILERLENIQETFIEEGLQGYEMVIVNTKNLINKLIARNKELEEGRKNGTLSDGYHTYNDLYYQRCILFATICNLNKDISWKSKKHSDGKKCFDSDEWFIVGIDTPEGSYTYHYEMKYWDLFQVQELEKGKIWDGHTEKDVTRLFSLVNEMIPKSKIKEKIEELDRRIDYLDKELAEAYIQREKLGTEIELDANEQYIYNMEQERIVRHIRKYAYKELLQ